MFVVQNNCRGIYDNNFIDNKELPMGNKSERLVYLTLQLFCNPTGNSAYNLFFDMQNENPIVTASVFANVTPLQRILVNNYINLQNVDDFIALYFYTLPYCKTPADAFLNVNILHYQRHQSFKYTSFQSFKTEMYG